MDSTLIFSRNITVEAAPSADDYTVNGASGGKVGDTSTLELKFHSNPSPDQIKWFMHDLSGPLLIPDLVLDRSDVNDEENIDINGTRYEFGNTTSMVNAG